MIDLQLVADGLAFPEGPVAMADGSVLLTEIRRNSLTRVRPDGTKDILAETAAGPNGAAIGPDGAVWIATNGGAFSYTERDGLVIPGPTPPGHDGGLIQRYDLATGRLDTVHEGLIAPNDLVFDETGGLWFTDHGVEMGEGRRYGGSITPRRRGASSASATTSSARTASASRPTAGPLRRRHLFAAALGVRPAGAGQARAAAGICAGAGSRQSAGYQLLDSLAVEAGGKVCVATIVNGGITVFDPDGSTEHVPVPDPVTTNICFGGADMRDAWITAGATGRLYKARWPRPGLRLAYDC